MWATSLRAGSRKNRIDIARLAAGRSPFEYRLNYLGEMREVSPGGMSKCANLINNSAIFWRARVIRLKRTKRPFPWPLVQANSVMT